MKITVNGVVLDNQDHLDVRIDIDPAGETMPPGKITLAGGTLTFRGEDTGLLITNEPAGGFLVLEGLDSGVAMINEVQPDPLRHWSEIPHMITVTATGSSVATFVTEYNGPDVTPEADAPVVVGE